MSSEPDAGYTSSISMEDTVILHRDSRGPIMSFEPFVDRESSRAIEVTTIDYTILLEGVPARPGWPLPNALVFLRSVPKLSLEQLPSGFPPCAICLTSFFAPNPEETPILLPCGHVLGSKCASQWLCPLTGENKNTWCVFSKFISFVKAPVLNFQTFWGTYRALIALILSLDMS